MYVNVRLNVFVCGHVHAIHMSGDQRTTWVAGSCLPHSLRQCLLAAGASVDSLQMPPISLWGV